MHTAGKRFPMPIAFQYKASSPSQWFDCATVGDVIGTLNLSLVLMRTQIAESCVAKSLPCLLGQN